MWRRVKVKTKPTLRPITLSELKLRVRAEESLDDPIVLSYLDGAIARIDGPSGIGYAVMDQAWELSLDVFPSVITLPGAPVSAVTSIKYYDVDDTLQTVTATDYRVDLGGDCVRIEPVDGWPATKSRFGAVLIEYRLGATVATDVPADLLDAVCLLVAHRYEQRQPVIVGTISSLLPLGIDSILSEYNRLAVA